MNYNKLRGRIIEKFGRYSNFADAIAVTPQTVWNKLTGKTEISQQEVRAWADILGIPNEEIGVYFFTLNVAKAEHED